MKKIFLILSVLLINNFANASATCTTTSAMAFMYFDTDAAGTNNDGNRHKVCIGPSLGDFGKKCLWVSGKSDGLETCGGVNWYGSYNEAGAALAQACSLAGGTPQIMPPSMNSCTSRPIGGDNDPLVDCVADDSVTIVKCGVEVRCTKCTSKFKLPPAQVQEAN